jgi:hypothetical protein
VTANCSAFQLSSNCRIGRQVAGEMSLADTLIAGKYRVGRKLGGGSFGEIYLGILKRCSFARKPF